MIVGLKHLIHKNCETKWKKAVPIWDDNKKGKDIYADFKAIFSYYVKKKVKVYVACDSAVELKVNGLLACFSACADFPDYKLYNEFDITKFCRQGENEIVFTVWHYGVDSQTYIYTDAFLLFKITVGEETVAVSDKDTLCRKNVNYKNGYQKIITTQMGFSFLYDNTVVSGSYHSATEKDLCFSLNKRPTFNLSLCERLPINISYKDNFVLIDMGKEVYGFIDIEIDCEKETKLLISYGEHISDGKVRRIIGSRDFSVEFIAKKGKNKYINGLRRIAGRYLEIENAEGANIIYLGIRPVVYPVDKKSFETDDKELRQIYDISVNTLMLCMHEHYEDCPWREQALYVLDSRNQMLCGYYAFNGYEYQRANLIYISKGLRKEGLLSLCFPSGIDIPIPFFSLCYIFAVSEYIEHTQDNRILSFAGPVLEKIKEAFDNRKESNGLIANFPYPYWNFYEWSEHSANENEINSSKNNIREHKYDLILNCAYVIFLEKYQKLFDVDCTESIKQLRKAIIATFYDNVNGIYKLSTVGNNYSQLGNSFVILAGIGDEKLVEKIIVGKNMDKITLSMNAFFYDAMLKVDNKYKKFIIEDIRRKYMPMVNVGATTFWETEKGEKDFDGAGSLCHGWSAMPVYYFNILK